MAKAISADRSPRNFRFGHNSGTISSFAVSTMSLTPTMRHLITLSMLLASACFAQVPAAKAVSGCELLKHPGRYNRKMVVVEGTHIWGFERDDLSFGCPGSIGIQPSIGIQLSVTDADSKKFGFRTEQASVDSTSQLPPGEHPGDNLTARKLRQAKVTVVGLFRCHYDFPTCKGASGDGSIIVKSVQFESPVTETED
jgi:hypothetical protein